MSKLIEGKIVVVIGGAGLLGAEFTKIIVNNGGVAIIAEYDVVTGESLKKELTNNEGVYVKEIDITSEKLVNKLIKDIDKEFGRIDAVINSAYPRNRNYGKHFFDVQYEDFCDNLGMNLGGAFLVGQIFSKYFIKQGSGNIINVSSIYGIVAPRFEVYDNTKMTMPIEYAAIKSGLLHITKYMAKYLKGKNIRVNAISLGGLEDGQPKAFLDRYKAFCLNKGMLNPEDISGTLLYLLSDYSKYVNGQNIVVDDGFTL